MNRESQPLIDLSIDHAGLEQASRGIYVSNAFEGYTTPFTATDLRTPDREGYARDLLSETLPRVVTVDTTRTVESIPDDEAPSPVSAAAAEASETPRPQRIGNFVTGLFKNGREAFVAGYKAEYASKRSVRTPSKTRPGQTRPASTGTRSRPSQTRPRSSSAAQRARQATTAAAHRASDAARKRYAGPEGRQRATADTKRAMALGSAVMRGIRKTRSTRRTR